jgi:anti-sigma regulatory factor (Ser/Thr protein kinase)
MEKLTVSADIANLDDVLAFAEEAACNLPPKSRNQLALAVEEIFVNIANYAYENGGEAQIVVDEQGDKLSLSFIDCGIPYNPLIKEDPDVTLSAEQRQIGGLGIFMVKKLTDGCEYMYKDGRNIFTIYKNVNPA